MRIIPKEFIGIIQFAEVHQPVWAQDPAQIGLTPDQMGPFTDQMKTAREMYDRALAARAASVAATTAMRTEVARLREMTAGLVATIKAYAATGGTEGYPADQILSIAQIDPPGRSPVRAITGRAPGKATWISAATMPTGGIRLTWTARDAAASTGAFFTVARRLAGESGFGLLGFSPGLSRTRRRAEFVDESVPAGVGSAQYQIVGRRARAIGEPSRIVTVAMSVAGPVAA
jgi:hypothetical protein